ncbi:substrate-binding domain-containing protein [Corynebacterium cystitidis]|uniref:Phosphate transport system substrate-binding protein n=1 Tax=Corynebacterium cystitidis DSM 20524 TaxID=1121357 RepID=A0A1H9VC71_9CORY|nr:substrate-binding domain-containing protein [Corynebacterium cystitidis]WJY82302.1 Phosphate-binding protein PstS precursor [Corynebacterium cystitidis DSM 20524]SES19141.1 phosphate transport system substrate-binding protein [Corynebacterium cystitidis DSM 20524]SNV76661.1 phosphate binding protein [Corynebacterium cystitidis]
MNRTTHWNPPQSTQIVAALLTASAVMLAGCSSESDGEAIRVTGSATVEPITQLAATEHKAQLEMTSDGTYDGFEQFCNGKSDINNASSAITQDYIDMCAADSEITTWADMRDGLSDDTITLAGRPDGSGTFSYFTAQVNGEPNSIREDYRTTDNMRELSSWIAEDENALGFMGVGNYLNSPEEDRNKMKTIAVDGVEPSLANAQSGTYQPLVRPLFIYINAESLETNAALNEFATAYVDNAASILPRVFFYGLTPEAYDAVSQRLKLRTEGTVMGGDPFQTVDIDTLVGNS